VDPNAFEKVFNERDEEVTFDEARNLVAAEELENVSIDDSEEVYESTESLIESITITWQCSEPNCDKRFDSTRKYIEHSHDDEIECEDCPRTFATQQEYEQHLPCDIPPKCSDCGRAFDTEESLTKHQPCPWPQTVTAKTDNPAVITEAVGTITAEIEDKVTQIKRSFNSSTHDIKQSLDGLTLKLQGNDAWKKGEWIAKQMPEKDGLQNVAVELEYEARYADSHVETHFDGSAKTFADTVKHTNKPSGSPDDQYIEVLIKADTSLELNRLDVLEDVIPGATTIEMSVRTTLELTEDEKQEMTP
jgi:DNA-directed RNA polymerase subunit RPC12/RpoP